MMESFILSQLSLKIVQAQHTNCSLQWPENFIVMVIQQRPNTDAIFESAKQTVTGMKNEYTVENLDLRQKYHVSIKLGKSISSSIAEIANFCKFYFPLSMSTSSLKEFSSVVFILYVCG